MYVTNIEERDKRKAVVYVDSGEKFPLYKGEIKKYGIKEQGELSESDYRFIMSEVLLKRGKERAMHILQGADKTEGQIREKLEKGMYPKQVIDDVIDFLMKYDYINDYNYAVSYIRTYSNSQSERLMREKLRQRGIKRDIIDDAMMETMEKTGYDAESIISSILQKRKYDADNADIKEKNRMISYLMRRGFKYDDILSVLKQCYQTD